MLHFWKKTRPFLLPLLLAGGSVCVPLYAQPLLQSQDNLNTDKGTQGLFLIEKEPFSATYKYTALSPQLVEGQEGAGSSPGYDSPLRFDDPGFAGEHEAGLAYQFDDNWSAHATVSEKSWTGASALQGCLTSHVSLGASKCVDSSSSSGLVNSRLGASFVHGGYRVDVDVDRTRGLYSGSGLSRFNSNAFLSSALGGVQLYNLSNSTRIQAYGSMALGSNSWIGIGAGAGYVHLLPGNRFGIESLQQKSLALGLSKGNISGHVVGRLMEPKLGLIEEGGLDGDSASRYWSSVDLGVTWHWPEKSSSLSFGAKNVWSSGKMPSAIDGSESDQSRMPYVQYHLDF